MNGRERIQKVMACEKPDRVPFDGLIPTKSDIFYVPLLPARTWQPHDSRDIYPQVYSPIMNAGLWKWTPKSWAPPKNWRNLPRTAVDEFGVRWEYAANDPSKGHPMGSPLHDWDQLAGWKFPDPYDPSHYRVFTKIAKLFPRKYKVGLLDSFLFARVQYLRGFSQSLIDLRRNKSQIKALLEMLNAYYLGTIEMFHNHGMDAVYAQDDMGAQNELFMSPKLYREHLMPVFAEILKVTHEYGMKFILHSCGHVNELLPTWYEMELDALQFDAPRMTGIDFLASYKGKFCFHLVPDIQQVYPFTDPHGLEMEVKDMIEKIGDTGGLVIRDYMKAHSVLKVPIQNVQYLPRAVRKWGIY
jgi:uroporphyrinogen decarboxylase